MRQTPDFALHISYELLAMIPMVSDLENACFGVNKTSSWIQALPAPPFRPLQTSVISRVSLSYTIR
jgi:hypothetical protein